MMELNDIVAQRLPPGRREILKRQGFAACYVVGVETQGPIKIGYASDMVTRLSQIQAAHWKPICIFGLFWFAGTPLAQRVEAAAIKHLKAEGNHIRGEWFETSAARAVQVVLSGASAMKLEWFTEQQRREFGENIHRRQVNKLCDLLRK